MLTTLEPTALAYVQAHALLGAIPELIRRVPAAASILATDPRPTSIAFRVHGGPTVTLAFADGQATLVPDRGRATIVLPFASPAAFSKVIAGEAQPIPVSGFHRVGFLLKVFAPLSEQLESTLRPSRTSLEDPQFRRTSTILTLYVACAAVAQLANHDPAGRVSALNTPDGDVSVEAGDDVAYTLRVRDHRMLFLPAASPSPRAALRFADLDAAARVLSGEASALASVCAGALSMRGMLSMVDNVSRLLDRAGQYLAD